MCLAIPGQIVEVVDESNQLARVDVAGVRRTVNIGLFDDTLALCEDAGGAHHTVELALVDAGAGDQVLVHAGVALVTL